jgi:carbonic anhydrase
MASSTEEELQQKVSESVGGTDASWMTLGAITDQAKTITADVHRVRSHPFIPADVVVGGFIYDVDSGLLNPVV